jgi:serine/threonine protein kinase
LARPAPALKSAPARPNAGKLAPEAAVRVAEQIAAALASAHDRGIVHRDLKPDNTFLCSHPDYPDHVKVLDFGVAKLVAANDRPAKRRTRAGTALGTPLYMSPEQCLGGLLHDAGKPIVGSLLLEAEKVLAREGRWLDDHAWLEVVHSSHRIVGCALADKWQMAPEVRRVIVSCEHYGEGAEARASNLVCFANAVAKQAGKAVGPVDREQVDELVARGAEWLGLDWRFVHTLVQHVGELERLYAPPTGR